MKKSIPYIFCLSMLSLSAFAQIPKGTSMIGGSISLSHQDSKPSDGSQHKSTSFNVQPSYGFFVIDNLAVGVIGGFDLDKSESEATYSSTTKSRSISAGPFARYYVPFNSKLYAFGQGSYAWKWSRSEAKYSNPAIPNTIVEKERTNSWALGAGLSYFLNPDIALEASVSYTHDRSKTDEPSEYVTIHKVDGLSFGIGFQIFFRKAD